VHQEPVPILTVAGASPQVFAAPARVVQLADLTEVAYRRRGHDVAREYARKRRGRNFDPALADLFITEAEDLVAGIDAASSC
jgi:hypothetical protein